MAEAFDPYVQWLAVQGGRRPGNHYELLGIDLFESDPAVVARAADALTARIRSVRPGPHVAEWQRLLDAVAGAKGCLLDPMAKGAYDAALRGQAGRPEPAVRPTQGQAPSATPLPVDPLAARSAGAYGSGASGPHVPSAVPMQAPPAPVAAVGPGDASPDFSQEAPAGSFPTPAVRTRRSTVAKPSAAQMVVYGLTLVFLAMAAMFAYMLYQQRRGTASDGRAASEADLVTAPANANGSTPRPRPPSFPQREKATSVNERRPPNTDQPASSMRPLAPVGGLQPAGGSNLEAKPEAKAAPGGKEQAGRDAQQPPGQQTSPQGTAMAGPPLDQQRQRAFREAVADLRFSMSEHDVAGARKHLQAAAANAQTPEERSEIDRLDSLLGYLEEFWKGMSRIVAKLESAEVLPVGDTFVAIVEVSPEQLTIKVDGQLRTYRIDRMPSRLVQALASARFADDPATKVLVGTYFLVDPDGDPSRARRLWEEAARAGIDVRDILPELGQWRGASSDSASPAPQRTAPPPDPQKLQQAEQTVREKFQAEYEQATSLAGKARLAKLLLEAAATTADDSDLRFVLLREARDQAVAAGDSDLAFQAIDQIVGFYGVDALAMKTAALAGAVKNARGAAAQRRIAQNALQLTEQAVKTRRLEEAGQLAEVALSAARQSNNRPLMQQAVLVLQQVQALQKQGEGPATRQPEAPPVPP